MPLDGTLFVLALHGTTPVCEPWTATPGELTYSDQRITYHMDGEDLVVDSFVHGPSSSDCGDKYEVTERDDGFDVDGARWFRTQAACKAAIAHHARVAMVWRCDPSWLATEEVPATRRRFDNVLAYGGFMYAEDTCTRVRFVASATTPTTLRGSLSYRIAGGLEEYGYQGKRGDTKLNLLGPSAVMDDGDGYGMGCLSERYLWYGTDHVTVMGDLFFDKKTCRAAAAREHYRDSWFPQPPEDDDDEEAGTQRLPIAGGC